MDQKYVPGAESQKYCKNSQCCLMSIGSQPVTRSWMDGSTPSSFSNPKHLLFVPAWICVSPTPLNWKFGHEIRRPQKKYKLLFFSSSDWFKHPWPTLQSNLVTRAALILLPISFTGFVETKTLCSHYCHYHWKTWMLKGIMGGREGDKFEFVIVWRPG